MGIEYKFGILAAIAGGALWNKSPFLAFCVIILASIFTFTEVQKK